MCVCIRAAITHKARCIILHMIIKLSVFRIRIYNYFKYALKALPFTREVSVCYKTLLSFTHAHYLLNDIKVTHAAIGWSGWLTQNWTPDLGSSYSRGRSLSFYAVTGLYQGTFILYPMSRRKTRGDVIKRQLIGNRTYFV